MKHRNSSVPRHVRFKIAATRCDLRIGDEVSPETIVGVDYESGEILTAGCHGRVEAVTFSGGEHSLIVVIERASELETT
ncbi:MAG: hypothetical protein ACLQPD_31475 [Desulfomonilaceae bacterium]